MVPMALNFTTLESEIEQAKTYFASGDYVNARKYLGLAEMTLQAIPNTTVGNQAIYYQRSMESLRKSIADMEANNANSRKGARVLATMVRMR